MPTESKMSQRTTGNARWPLILLVGTALLLPTVAWFVVPRLPAGGALPVFSGGVRYPSSQLPLRQVALGAAPLAESPPRLTNVQIVDFDKDGRPDVVACDARLNRIVLYRQTENSDWEEKTLATDLVAPAHATVVDLDADGDLDIVVSVLGDIWPNDQRVGRLVLLENTGDSFVRHVILDNVRRVADAQAGDLDADGDLDLAVAVFG